MTRERHPLPRLVTALVLFGVAGCASAPERVPPVLGGVPADQVEALVRRWETDWRSFTGLRAAVDLTIVRSGRVQRSAGALLISPTHLRFEIITPLGFPAFIVIAGPERILVFNPVERQAWTARPTAEAMGRWMGVPVAPEMLIRLLVGQAPPPPDGVPVRVADDRGPHLVFERDGGREQVWVTPEGLPARIELQDGQRLIVTFERTVGGPIQGLVLEAPRQSLEVRLRYISGQLTTPPPEAFTLQLPPDVPVERLD